MSARAEETHTDLNAAAAQFAVAAKAVVAAYNARRPAASNQVTPVQLVVAMEQFLSITTKLDAEEGERGPLPDDDATQLGDHGLTLLADLIAWTGQLGMKSGHAELDQTVLAIADWIVRHEGRLRTLEPIVNALAQRANTLEEPAELEALAGTMTHIVHATDDLVKQDLEQTDPGRPWRLLQLNRAIVATRSYNAALMEQIFDELVRDLPGDVAGFFAQGMQQMTALNYPPHVRTVMQRYYAAWTQHKLHQPNWRAT